MLQHEYDRSDFTLLCHYYITDAVAIRVTVHVELHCTTAVPAATNHLLLGNHTLPLHVCHVTLPPSLLHSVCEIKSASVAAGVWEPRCHLAYSHFTCYFTFTHSSSMQPVSSHKRPPTTLEYTKTHLPRFPMMTPLHSPTCLI